MPGLEVFVDTSGWASLVDKTQPRHDVAAELYRNKRQQGWGVITTNYVTWITCRFLVVIEKAEGNDSAYSPDLPGCVATGKTRDQVTRNMHKAIDMNVCGLLEDMLSVPPSRSFAEYVAIPA